ncbi:MAG: enoyl-CoA hydratase family protein [Proteobacteria bacterium]|nr:enoyl-CoA hydratase family protein [Pseudomonadota bacterium]
MNPETYNAKHFKWDFRDGIATITLNRPEKKNPLTFESYAELRDTFRALGENSTVRAVILTGAGGNFCSGGDVHEIIGPLVKMDHKELLDFTQMTGDVVKAMLQSAQPIIAAVDGVCVGAGAILAMASDIRLATPGARTAFLFNKVGLAGCDMGACAMLPRIIGQSRAAELLYLGRVMSAEEGFSWGFFNHLVKTKNLMTEARTFAEKIAKGPPLANSVTKKQLLREWDMGLLKAIDEEAVEQAKLMKTNDFRRAYKAFVNKEKPEFKGD